MNGNGTEAAYDALLDMIEEDDFDDEELEEFDEDFDALEEDEDYDDDDSAEILNLLAPGIGGIASGISSLLGGGRRRGSRRRVPGMPSLPFAPLPFATKKDLRKVETRVRSNRKFIQRVNKDVGRERKARALQDRRIRRNLGKANKRLDGVKKELGDVKTMAMLSFLDSSGSGDDLLPLLLLSGGLGGGGSSGGMDPILLLAVAGGL